MFATIRDPRAVRWNRVHK